MDDRLHLAISFLNRTVWADIKPVMLAGDASARRYFRLTRLNNHSAILMDAPVEDGQDIKPFIHVASILRNNGLNAPEILAVDDQHGFLLLEDFGDALFAQVVADDPNMEMDLYRCAVDVLVKLNQLSPRSELPVFSTDHMAEMISPAYEWYRKTLVGDTGDSQPAQKLLAQALQTVDGQAMSLRDFHAENLIWLPKRDGNQKVGLLDFQDAMIGPRGYDLVSLLMDARRDVSAPVVDVMIKKFADEAGLDPEHLRQSYAVIGVQRNLRILGIFVRLAVKMQRPRYLDFLPRVWRYVDESLKHPALNDLANCIHADLPMPTPEMIEGLRKTCGPIPKP